MARRAKNNQSNPAQQPGAGAEAQSNTTSRPKVIDLGSRIQVQNTSHEIQIIPLGDNRKRLAPNEIWTVQNEYVDVVKGYFKTPFYQAMEANGFLKIHTSAPSRLGEADFKSPETPAPPEDLVEKPEHVTQAEFVQDKEKE